jgi:hypothetical protein
LNDFFELYDHTKIELIAHTVGQFTRFFFGKKFNEKNIQKSRFISFWKPFPFVDHKLKYNPGDGLFPAGKK